MNITGKGKIYKSQKYGNYSIRESQKDMNGNYVDYYIPVSFPKSMSILPDDREIIEIKGFTKHYKSKDDKTMFSYVIMEWKSVGVEKQDTEETPKRQIEETPKEDPYAQFGEENIITDADLPF